ncbi:MAG: P-type conjugative transfer protein TrbG [Litorimonas sp.]
MRAALITLALSSSLLSGCSTLSLGKTAPADFVLDEVPMREAVLQPAEADGGDASEAKDTAPQTVIVERFTAVPLPGQLKRREWLESADTADRKPSAKPHEIIDAAHAGATVGPKPGSYVNAIQVYAFARGALYQVFTAPEQVTDIALQPGERLISVSAGDTERWILGDTVSGEGDTERVHILVKPVESGLTTNLVVTTSERVYRAELTSYRETYMAGVSWRYPLEELMSLSKRRKVKESARTVPASSSDGSASVSPLLPTDDPRPLGLSVDALNFRYAVTGDRPHWRPLRAFDDGRKVYIQFPARLDQGEAPPLFVVGADGVTQLVNYRVKGRYYVVDRLFAAAELRLGEKDQQVVRIERVAQ